MDGDDFFDGVKGEFPFLLGPQDFTLHLLSLENGPQAIHEL